MMTFTPGPNLRCDISRISLQLFQLFPPDLVGLRDAPPPHLAVAMAFPCLAMPSHYRGWGGRRSTPTHDVMHEELGLALPSARGGERQRREAAQASTHLMSFFPRGGRPPSAGSTGLRMGTVSRAPPLAPPCNFGRSGNGRWHSFVDGPGANASGPLTTREVLERTGGPDVNRRSIDYEGYSRQSVVSKAPTSVRARAYPKVALHKSLD